MRQLEVVIVLIVLAVAGWGSAFSIHREATVWKQRYENLSEQFSSLQSRYADLENAYASLSWNYSELQSDYDGLLLEYHDLQEDYQTLQGEYYDLLDRYNGLVDDWNKLVEDYNSFINEYNDLVNKYNNLSYKIELISQLYDPVKYKQTPFIAELKYWLRTDRTDQVEYVDPDYVCFHFAVTLMLHGRAHHYQIGVIYVHGYDIVTGEEFRHAINAIVTHEGLVYIEPQTDDIWWLENHQEITPGEAYEFPGFENPIYVQEVIIVFNY